MRRLAVAAAGSLIACTAWAQEPVRSLFEMRTAGVVVQRWDTSCGAAALATVLTFAFNDAVSEEVAARAMLRHTSPLRVRARGGFSLLDLKRFAEGRGYAAAGYRGLDLDQLLRLPSPIVPIDERVGAHFVVVRGMRDGMLDIADPAFGNRLMRVEHFVEIWQGGIAFAIRRGS